MIKVRFALALLPLIAATPAAAATVVDPVGDFLPTYVFAHNPDLDVTSFSVLYNPGTMSFLLGGTLAGPIDTSLPGLYVIGVNTGLGAIAPFGGIGEPNVRFDQAIIVHKDGSVTLGINTLGAIVGGNAFALNVPLSLLPATVPGFQPGSYGFNLWPRIDLGNNNQISDFAPENSLLQAVPEPAAWMMMLLGFGLVGAAMRFRRRAGLSQLA